MRGPESDSKTPVSVNLIPGFLFLLALTSHTYTQTYNYEFKNMLNSNQTTR